VIGLPTLAQLDGAAATTSPPVRIWLASEPADMRCGFDCLAELAQRVTGQDPLSGHLFLFRSRGGDRLKVLYWDKDGLALWYKRLKEGTFKLPRVDAGATSVELRPASWRCCWTLSTCGASNGSSDIGGRDRRHRKAIGRPAR
jgi:transposase